MFEFLSDLKKSGLLSKCVQYGLIPFHVPIWHELAEYYQDRRKAGRSKYYAKRDAAEAFRVSVKTVYKVLNFFGVS